MFFIGYDSLVPFSVEGFITSYFGAAYAFVAFLLWKFVKRTRFVSAKTADLYSGKTEIDYECRYWESSDFEEARRQERAKMSVFRRTWERIW